MIVLEFAAVPAVKIMRTNGGVSNNQALVVDIFRVRSRAATKLTRMTFWTVVKFVLRCLLAFAVAHYWLFVAAEFTAYTH